jgi:hypothetical protein
MTFGPARCACCGSTEGVEAHHLYSRNAGCPDDLTVWLCFVCHGRAHELKRRVNTCELTKAGLAAAKARGVKLGNPNLRAGSSAAVAVARDAHTQQARQRALAVLPFITAAQRAGAVTLREIAAAMEARGIRTPSGRGRWHAATILAVQRIATSSLAETAQPLARVA